jgi:hypothetical protein
MAEVIQSGKSDAQRIADRLKPSCSPDAVTTYVTIGSGPTRTVTSIHRSGQNIQHGQPDVGGPDISGGKR